MDDRIILGENCIYSADCSKTGLNNNVLVVGTSGCGKTKSITEPCLLETYKRSLICTVTKRQIVNKYKPLLQQRGYDFQDLDFVHPEKGDIGYDPLRYVRSYQDIVSLAESIVNANPKKESVKKDPYWDNAAKSLLCGEITYVLMTKDHANFSDVLNMHDHLEFKDNGGQISTSYDEKFDYLASKDPNSFAVTNWKSFRMLPLSTASCVFGTLNTALDSVFNPALREIMAMERQVDFEKIGKEQTILTVTTSPVNPANHCFVNIFYEQLFKQLFEFAEEQPDGTLPVPVHVVADDFATGSKIMNFAEYISIFREKKISVALLIQSESQLESIYGSSDATTIINNCDSYIYMGGMDIKTAQNISLRLNVPLDEVLYMPLGKEFVFRRGQKPIVTSRYKILENELYQKITKHYEQSIATLAR